MSEILELVLQLIFGVLEGLAETWFGSVSFPDTIASRICLGSMIAALGVIIWLEIH